MSTGKVKRATTDNELKEQGPVCVGTHVDNILHSFFSIVEVYDNNQKKYKSRSCMCSNFTFKTTSRQQFSITKEFGTQGQKEWIGRIFG